MNNEELIQEEQPQQTVHSAAAQDDTGTLDNAGSSFGKFKSANDLLEAYNNLQSEFTRKCQRLKELESADSDKASTPLYDNDSWQEQIGQFLEAHPNAKQYAREIADVIYSDKTLATNPSSLEIAYARILDSKYKSYDDIASDEDFLNTYVYNNPNITSKVLDNYLHNYSKTPHLITSKVGASVNLTPAPKASNLSEAKRLVEQLFK